jgi:DNA replication protein DnaC
MSLPAHHYDTAKVVYRVVDVEGFVSYGHKQYSVPWRRVGQLLPVRVTDTELFVYDRRIKLLARHPLWLGLTGQRRIDPTHRPPKNRQKQLAQLRATFAQRGEVATEFLEGLLKQQRYGLKQTQRVLALIRAYSRSDVLAASKLSHLELLERFLSVPADGRRERAIERRIRLAKFRDEATFESFDWEFNRRTIDRVPFEELGTGQFVQRRDHLVFAGQSGLGKSHLIQAVGRRCCVEGYSVRYTTSAELLEDLIRASGERRLPSRVRYYSRFDLLIIDEFGFEKLERLEYPESPSLLYKVIDRRNRRGSTALVTNVDFQDWTSYLGDPPLAMALLDRVVTDAIVQKFKGKSYRDYRSQHKNGARNGTPGKPTNGHPALQNGTSRRSS